MAEHGNCFFRCPANYTIIFTLPLISELAQPRVQAIRYDLGGAYDLALAIRLFCVPRFVGQGFAFGCKDVGKVPRMSVCQNRLSVNRSPRYFSHKITRDHLYPKHFCGILCGLERSSFCRRKHLHDSAIFLSFCRGGGLLVPKLSQTVVCVIRVPMTNKIYLHILDVLSVTKMQ